MYSTGCLFNLVVLCLCSSRKHEISVWFMSLAVVFLRTTYKIPPAAQIQSRVRSQYLERQKSDTSGITADNSRPLATQVSIFCCLHNSARFSCSAYRLQYSWRSHCDACLFVIKNDWQQVLINFCYISGRNDEIRKLNPSVSQRKSLSHLVAVVKAISQSRMASFWPTVVPNINNNKRSV